MEKNKTGKYFKYAIGEIILVVIGILIALQINNWNENRKSQKEEVFILSKLQSDINSDINSIKQRIEQNEGQIANYIYCLEVLGRKKEVTKKEFLSKFGSILGIQFFDQNTSTFSNLISSGKLELISNKTLSESIVKYYTGDYKGWDTGMRDYTRNIIAPYLIKFDHIPQRDETEGINYEYDVTFYRADLTSFDMKPKTIEDYRKDLFIINILRQKLYNYQGQTGAYSDLLKEMEELTLLIEKEKITKG